MCCLHRPTGRGPIAWHRIFLPLILLLDERIHTLAVRRNVDANASPIAFGQPVSSSIDIEASPRLAGVLRTVKPATRPVDWSIRAPRRPPRMPMPGKQNLRRAGTYRQI